MNAVRPGPDEFANAYAGYVTQVTEPDPLTAMASQIDVTTALLRGVSESDALKRYAPGKWSVKEVVGHLADTERIMAYRALRIARADATPLPGFDDNAFVPPAKFDARPLTDLLGDLKTIRLGTLALFRSFDADAWRRRGTASGNPISVRALAYVIPGHERHHVEVLKTRYGLR
jgi:DinB family protein